MQIESGIDISDTGMEYEDNYNLENTCQRDRKEKEEKLNELKEKFNSQLNNFKNRKADLITFQKENRNESRDFNAISQ